MNEDFSIVKMLLYKWLCFGRLNDGVKNALVLDLDEFVCFMIIGKLLNFFEFNEMK